MKTRKWVRRSLCTVVAMTAQGAMAAESSAKIEELIVKGLKVERSLQDTPVSVDLATAKQIEERGLMD